MVSSSLQPDAPTSAASLWVERLALLFVVAAYLWTFTPDHPNGDGWSYIRSIETGAFNWNPNHLYMQPAGLVFTKLVAAVGLGWSTFTSLKVLSALSAVTAVLLFHAALLAAGCGSAGTRLFGSLGLFFSAQFISLSLAEEFFSLQMPFLGAIFLAMVRWLDTRRIPLLVGVGVLLALVNLVQINSAPLAIFLGLYAAYEASRAERVRSLLAVWIPGIVVGVPMVLLPYLMSSRRQGLVAWLTSYQGQSDNSLGALYGIELTPIGVVKSAATLVYGFTMSLAGLGDLGTVAEAVATRKGLEFTPNLPLLVATGLLFLLLGVGILGLLWWWWTRGRRLPLGRFAMVWLVSYLVFNFLWVDTADQFWAPILPALWLGIVLWIDGGAERARGGAPAGWRRPALVLGVVAVLLATANTGTVALYRAFTNVDRNQAALLQLLRPNDLLITMGWDDIAWLTWDEGLPYQRVTLMPLALKGRAQSEGMKRLPERIQTHLATGGRVLVARVFDRDREARPWEQMARLGWPRRRVVELLAPFSRQPLAEIGGVRLHTLTDAPSSTAERNH
jgi:hypothetical protein